VVQVMVVSTAQLPEVQVPVDASQTWPLVHESAVQLGGFGSHDERAVSQW
jgi:hypothetical protein